MSTKYKQTTLFGGIAKDEDHIYKEPGNTYEKFIEMWWQRARARHERGSKQDLLKQAQVQCNDSMDMEM